ncbi:MAG: hypothetical protein ACI87O_002631 [Planctomycetota bacterium]|jgi:hypothetical protein
MNEKKELNPQERAYSDAINAANRSLFEAGFKDEMVVEIRLAATSAITNMATSADSPATSTYACACWDCASAGCNAGPCCCNGPAC